MNIKEKLQELNSLRQSYEIASNNLMKESSKIEKELDIVEKSQVFVQSLAESIQSKLSSKIDDIVNLGLATCFSGYSFETKYVPSRGKTEVQFVVRNGDSIIDPLAQCGGGLVDIICFCLRISVYAISNVADVLVFDEPFKFVSKGHREKVSELLKILSERLNLQVIEVTHIDELSENSDKKIMIKKIDGVSKIMED